MNGFPSERQVKMIKDRYPKGSRIQLNHMGDDPHPIPDGMKGTVDFVDDIGTVFCKFDNGRSLGLVYGEDSFHSVPPDEPEMTDDMQLC